MTTEPQSPLSETEKRAAFLAELEAERQRRIEAGKWGRGVRPRLMAIPQAGETLQAAQQRNPAGRVRIRNIMPIARDYSRASQSFLLRCLICAVV